MAAERLDLETVFHAARQVPPPDRAAYLDRACGNDPAARRRVERLLAAEPEVGSFLDSPAPELDATAELPADTEQPGAVIGSCKLLEQIGEGAFGVVFLAEQTEPVRRKVALKVLKAGMETKQVVARFEAERQALAIMDHPNIARVFDGGTTNGGRPYFVMELVRGLPITEYCDHHRLNPRDRLGLFQSLCSAVQHAHQKGVIHRDLKPSNVLVSMHDATPVVKVIDFGIAKALGQELTDRTFFTGFAQLVGTPAYMSPEQAGLSGLDVDTRSDVYSLGVLLYELLTGSTPFDKDRLRAAGYDELRRIIREEEPARPSDRLSTLGPVAETVSGNRGSEPKRLTALVRGELDWIVMKCLEKDRNRRYETASALAADVQRYLADEPVLACPPSVGYRFRKFARRNKSALLTVSLVLVILLSAVAGLAIGAVRLAQEERDKSEALKNEKEANQEKDDALDEKKRANDVMRKALYRHSIALAHREWLSGNLERAEQLLDDCPADLRHWEWHYLKRLCRQDTLTLPEQAPLGSGVAFSPVGNRLASFVRDHSVKVWDATTGRAVLTLRGHDRDGVAVAFSPNGRHLASASRDGSINVWDLTAGKAVHTLRGHTGAVQNVAYSPDGQSLASSGVDGSVRIWDPESGREFPALRAPGRGISSLAYSSDGRRLAWATIAPADGVKVRELETGKEVLTLPGSFALAVGKAAGRDGELIAAAGEDWSEVNVFDGVSGTKLWTLRGQAGPVRGVSLSRDGRFLATACTDRMVKVWDLTTGREFRTFRGHDEAVRHVAFSPDGERLVSTSERGTVKIWQMPADQESRTFHWPPGHEIGGVAFDSDGRCLALVYERDTLRVVDVAGGQERLVFRGVHHNHAQLDAAARRMIRVAPDRTVTVCEVPTGNVVRSFPALPTNIPTLSPEGRRLVSTGPDRVWRVWDLTTAQELLARPLVRVPTPPTFKTTVPLYFPPRATFSADGRVFACSLDGEVIQVLDLEEGRVVCAFRELPRTLGDLRLSDDGRRLAWVRRIDTIQVADAMTGDELLVLRGGTSPVMRLAFSPDGERLASGSAHGSISVWELETGQEVLTLRGHVREAGFLAFSADGYRLASTGRDRTVRIWDATPLAAPRGTEKPNEDTPP